MNNYLIYDTIAVVLLFCIGLYTLIVSRNLLRMLIGFEIISKGATLAIITAGSVNGKIVFSQAIAITAIVVEVVFIAIALAIVMIIQRKKQSLDVRKLTHLKG